MGQSEKEPRMTYRDCYCLTVSGTCNFQPRFLGRLKLRIFLFFIARFSHVSRIFDKPLSTTRGGIKKIFNVSRSYCENSLAEFRFEVSQAGFSNFRFSPERLSAGGVLFTLTTAFLSWELKLRLVIRRESVRAKCNFVLQGALFQGKIKDSRHPRNKGSTAEPNSRHECEIFLKRCKVGNLSMC